MNVTTYAFTILAARLLGPAEYGALAAVMGLLLVVNVLSLGLQATGARRVSAAPHRRPQIEHEVLATSYASALVLGLVVLAASPLVTATLNLDSWGAAALIAATAVPLIGDGRPGRDPPGRGALGAAGRHLPRRRRRPAGLRRGRARAGAEHPGGDGRRHLRRGAAGRDRVGGAAAPLPRAGTAPRAAAAVGPLGQGRRAPRGHAQLPRPAGVLRTLQRRRHHRPQHPRRAPGRPVRRGPDPHEGGAVPAAVRGGHRVPLDVQAERPADASPEPRSGARDRPGHRRRRRGAVADRGELRRRAGVLRPAGPAVAVRGARHAARDDPADGLRRRRPPAPADGVRRLGGAGRAWPAWPRSWAR